MECHNTSRLGYCLGEFNGMIVSYAQYYFHQDHVLLTHTYATSTTVTTIGDGGGPRGSTELNNKSSHNCQMTDADFRIFAHLILGLSSTHNGMGTHRKQRTCAARPLLCQHASCWLCNNHQPPSSHPQRDCRQSTSPCLSTCPMYPSPS